MQKLIQVEIRKPLYGSFCNIRTSIIDQAIRNHALLEIKIPQGTAIHDPKVWKDTGKPTSQIFKFADSPLKMIGNFVFPNVAKITDNKQLKLI